MQLHVRDSHLGFMHQVRRQVCSQLGDSEFLPRYFECAEWACIRKVLLSVARPGRGYVYWATRKTRGSSQELVHSQTLTAALHLGHRRS